MFYYDYNDIQLQLLAPNELIPIPLVRNASSACIWGVEVEGSLLPIDSLTIEASLAFLDAAFSDLDALNPIDPSPIQDSDLSGSRMPRAPEFSAYVGVEVTQPISTLGRITLRADSRFQSRVFFDVFQDHFASQGPANVANAASRSRRARVADSSPFSAVISAMNSSPRTKSASMGGSGISSSGRRRARPDSR